MATKALPSGSHIGFETLGIGEVITRNRLRVPPNQRQYAWTGDREVSSFLTDINGAIGKSKPAYFLGTIVMTDTDDPSVKEVVDGQQRLATTVIFLSAVRDFYKEIDEEPRGAGIQAEFLSIFDHDAGEMEPRMQLNVDDNEFFRRAIVCPPSKKDMRPGPKGRSNERISAAAKVISDYIHAITKPHPRNAQIQLLNQWVKFLRQQALVNVLVVPDDLNAFVMFETLNDRGLKTSQADMVKNHLFEQSEKRKSEAHVRWSAMTGALETLDIEDVTLLYLRHLASALYGATREKDLLATVKKRVSGATNSMVFLETLSSYADDYVAIVNPSHPKWNDYNPAIRKSVNTLGVLGAEQIRPLLLAVAHHFSNKQAVISFRLFVSWIVRFLIVGGARGGTLDAAYSDTATKVCAGKITTAQQVQDAMKSIIPTDAAFQAAFESSSVTKVTLARYYLRAMELHEQGEPEPEMIPNEDQTQITLEHVLPQNAGKDWSIKPEVAAAFYKRIGNLVLLKAHSNSIIGNKPFSSKKPELAKSAYLLTEMVASANDWGTEQIETRQKKLAAIAVKTWSLRT